MVIEHSGQRKRLHGDDSTFFSREFVEEILKFDNAIIYSTKSKIVGRSRKPPKDPRKNSENMYHGKPWLKEMIVGRSKRQSDSTLYDREHIFISHYYLFLSHFTF